ncbi:Protein IMPAIRED IN BABA-INDUCED STERILITY 1 [Linum perenne]
MSSNHEKDDKFNNNNHSSSTKDVKVEEAAVESGGGGRKSKKIDQGTYSNVYKVRDRDSGKIVALKKVRFDTSEPESIKFMAREIMVLQKLDHPNIIKLEEIATSRMQYSLYLVFDYMLSDLT